MGADCGHYMNDIPTVFVSLENPYHLQDFPRVKTYINCYSNNDHCLHQLIEKLTGRSTFKGRTPRGCLLRQVGRTPVNQLGSRS